MEDVQPEVEEAGADGFPVDGEVFLRQVPAPGPHHQGGGLVVEAVVLARGEQLDRSLDCVLKVDLTDDQVVPGRGVGVFEIGHEDPGPGVQGVDHHLALHRAGDLHPPVGEGLGGLGHRPLAMANVGGFGEEIRPLAGVEAGLALGAGGEQLAPAGVETLVQSDQEVDGLGGQYPLGGGVGREADVRRHGEDYEKDRHCLSSELQMYL